MRVPPQATPTLAAFVAEVVAQSSLCDLRELHLPPDDPWALSLDACRFLATWIRDRKPRIVVEFGAGLSTYVIARELLAIPGGRLFSFEHLRPVSESVMRGLAVRGLARACTMHRCGIRLGWYGGRPLFFYRIPRSVWRALPPIDLALVDGPPVYNFGREAAGYKLLPKMAPDGWIMLDDADRSHERQCIDIWNHYTRGALMACRIDCGEPGRSLALLHPTTRGPFRWSAIRALCAARETASRWRNLSSEDRQHVLSVLLPTGDRDV